MNNQELLNRITADRKISDGEPIIRGHCIAVEYVLGMLAAGNTTENILEGHPSLQLEDIQACLLYAQGLVQTVRPELKVEELVDAVPDILEKAPYLTLLVLFGSRARGNASPQSDWDFAFLCDENYRKQHEKGGLDSFRIWGILQRSYDLADDQIDVIEMKSCSELMAHYIAQDGLVIYEHSPGLFENFKHYHLKTPEEMKELELELRNRTKQKLQELKQS